LDLSQRKSSGVKKAFFARTAPFFGHEARLYALKETSFEKKDAFTFLADALQQVRYKRYTFSDAVIERSSLKFRKEKNGRKIHVPRA